MKNIQVFLSVGKKASDAFLSNWKLKIKLNLVFLFHTKVIIIPSGPSLIFIDLESLMININQ